MQPNVDIQALNQEIATQSAFVRRLQSETAKVIIGQERMMERLLLGLLARGHVLLEGLPGLAKTLAIRTLSKAVQADFSRIQFTPDLLPSDIVGTMIYNQQQNDFKVSKGPIFSNFVLADEINRAPAKVQAALLEAMQERQVTIGTETFRLEEPFLVLATQNPIEQGGTYALPEAQTDRFMLKVVIDYPTKQDELQIIRLNMGTAELTGSVEPVVTPQQIVEARRLVRRIYMDEKVEQYIIDLVFATRRPSDYGMDNLAPLIGYGGSPRASINLALAAKALAFMQGRGYVIPEDVRYICRDVLRHRIGLTYEAEAENITQVDIIDEILNRVEIP